MNKVKFMYSNIMITQVTCQHDLLEMIKSKANIQTLPALYIIFIRETKIRPINQSGFQSPLSCHLLQIDIILLGCSKCSIPYTIQCDTLFSIMARLLRLLMICYCHGYSLFLLSVFARVTIKMNWVWGRSMLDQNNTKEIFVLPMRLHFVLFNNAGLINWCFHVCWTRRYV